MATKAGSIYTEIRARLDKYERDLKKAQGITNRGADKIQRRINKISFRKAANSMANFTRLFNTATIALAGGGALGSLIKISSDYENSVFQMSHTFQGQTDAMIAKAKDMAAQFRYFYDFNDISYAFTKTADSMERYGITGQKYIDLVTRAADIGAAKNLELKESIDRIESAMRGEAEASEYLGLTLNDTYMKNIAFEGALKDTWETMTDMQKTQARFNELMNQSAKYQGAAQEAAGQLSGAMASLGKAIKERLAPYLESANEAMTGLITKLRDLWTAEKTYSKQAGLKTQQEALITRQQSIQAAIQEIAKSNTPNKQEILDRMFIKLGLVQNKLAIVSGELYALEKQAQQAFKAAGSSGASLGGGAENLVEPGGFDYGGTAIESTRFKRAEIIQRDAVNMQRAYEMGQKLAENAPLDTWQTKAERVFTSVQDSAETAFETINRSVSTVSTSMGDALADFAMQGKLNFNSLAQSIIADLIRIQAQAVSTNFFGAVVGGIGSLFSPAATMPSTIRGGQGGGYGFDSGGYIGEPVRGVGMKTGSSYEFHANEVVTPVGKLGGGSKTEVTVNNYSGQQANVQDNTDPDGLRRIIIDIAKSDIMRGGQLARAHEQVYAVSRRGRLV